MSVRPHPRKEGFWIVDYRPDGVKGPRRRHPLKGTYEEAQAFESAMMTRSSYQVKSTMSLQGMKSSWLSYYRNHAAPTTLIDAKGSLKHLLSFMGNLRPKSLNPDIVESYKSKRLKDGVKKRTVNKELSYLSSMLRWAVEHGHCEPLPFRIKAFPKKHTKPKSPRPLSQEQVTALLTAIEPEYRLLVMLMADAGLRLSEARLLKREDIELDVGVLIVVGKGSKERIVPITTNRLRAELEARAGVTGYLSVNPGTNKPYYSIRKALIRAARKAGIDKHVHAHLLRHTFGTNVTMAGASLKSVQSMMGHSTPNTTQIYQHLAADYIKKQGLKLNKRVHVDADE